MDSNRHQIACMHAYTHTHAFLKGGKKEVKENHMPLKRTISQAQKRHLQQTKKKSEQLSINIINYSKIQQEKLTTENKNPIYTHTHKHISHQRPYNRNR